ncbi:MAG: hypothetical protein IJB68_10190 [Ruminococcus sp.]|nr:hypothetical protein [Ruminococcus sp.]
MIWNGEWEYYNQDYLKSLYEKKVSGECPDLAVRKIYCKGCGRVFKRRSKPRNIVCTPCAAIEVIKRN